MILVQKAEPKDVVSILKLMQKSGLPINEHDVLLWIAETVCNGVCLNATLGGRVVGSMGIVARRMPWNRSVIMVEPQWLHIADNFTESDARDKLLIVASALSRAVGFEPRLQ